MFPIIPPITLKILYSVVIVILSADLNCAVHPKVAKNNSIMSLIPSSGKRDGKYLVFPTPGSFVATKVQVNNNFKVVHIYYYFYCFYSLIDE